jgi:hypothetical protein
MPLFFTHFTAAFRHCFLDAAVLHAGVSLLLFATAFRERYQGIIFKKR